MKAFINAKLGHGKSKTSPMSASPLSALANIISSNVQSLEAAYASSGAKFPSLNDPFNPTAQDFDPTLAQTKALIVAAASQIIASVNSPLETLHDYSLSMFLTAGLGFAVDTNIPDILSEAGPQGLHVKDISDKTGVDSSDIARVMRFLATRHVFREVTPNVFANNRISSSASKSKSLEEIKADPDSRLDNAPVASFLSHFADEPFASSVHLSKFLQSPKEATAPFNLAFKTDAKVWEWYELPENKWRGKKFTLSMKGGASRWPADLFVNGVDVKNMKDNEVVVDVGGSVGSCTLFLYTANPKLKYIVQDLPSVVNNAKAFWNERAPQALTSGNVSLQVQNFFDPQTVKGASVYILRVVIHDWPDKEAKTILKNLREAADKNSKLVLFDFVARHVCEDPSSADKQAPVPYPLLPNLGIARGGLPTAIDLQMMNMVNGKHRTEKEWRELGDSIGWKLSSVVQGMLATLTFTPA